MKVSFTVVGEPTGKGRPRYVSQGSFNKTYTPKETAAYENLVKVEYRRQCGTVKFDKKVPLDVRITAYFQIPESESKKKKGLMEARKIQSTICASSW